MLRRVIQGADYFKMCEALRLHGLIAMFQDFGPIHVNTARIFIIEAASLPEVISFVDTHQKPPFGWQAVLMNDSVITFGTQATMVFD
jgi:hypothetical protein